MDRLATCIERIRDWMADNHMKLNEEKTLIIWLGTRQQLNKVTARALTLPNATVEFSTTAKDLGVVLDSQLTMADHIAALSRSCFFYIRQLRSIRQSLTTDAMKTLVYAFVSSCIDYCNSILAGVSDQLLQRLQLVQNAAARLVTGARRSDRMTPILRQLHWLPVRQRITFKTAVLSPYLSTYCEPTSSHGGRCHLRSAESGQLTVPRMRTNYGDRSFAVHEPVVWNSLPSADLRLLNISLPVFRKRLKMFLF